MTKPVLLFRGCLAEQNEFDIASKYFDVYTSRSCVMKDSTVIGRYSVLPFYEELEQDLKVVNSKLINTYKQHRYVANLDNWKKDLEGLTPRHWVSLNEAPENISFVLKGETNSRKYQWATHMFAKDKNAAKHVYANLLVDSLIGQQQIYFIEYVPLQQIDEGINGMPISLEYRYFVYKGNVVSSGFYWQNIVEDSHLYSNTDEFIPKEFIQEAINRIGNKIDFYTLDVAMTADDQPIVIELNDGQMAGLSGNDAELFYSRLNFF